MIKVSASIAIFMAASLVTGSCGTKVEANDKSVQILVDSGAVLREEFPRYLFGFNINHYAFENDFLGKDGKIPDQVIRDLRVFEDSMYRYPGGLVANRFWWEAAVDSRPGSGTRPPQKKVEHEAGSPVRFGINEYLDFVGEVGGRPWYVLNLVGWDPDRMISEMPAEEIAVSNARLAELIRARSRDDYPRYYQLGNELDRAEYQWPTEKYIERAQSTMTAIRKVDPDARFVAFLRDFDWIYKDAARRGTKSLYTDFVPEVLQGLPEVDDFSLHFYYDDPGNDRPIKTIQRRLQQFRRVIDLASQARNGDTPDVWITEHARGVDLPRGRPMDRAHLTGNLAAAVSTADFLIGISQIPAIKGAFLHGLNAGPWQVFDASVVHRDLRPRPVYWGMAVLRSVQLAETLKTTTMAIGENVTSEYVGGYDVSASGFSSADRSELGLWVANRASLPQDAQIKFADLANKVVAVRHNYIALPTGKDIEERFLKPELNMDAAVSCQLFSADGVMGLSLPAGSVSGIHISVADVKTCPEALAAG